MLTDRPAEDVRRVPQVLADDDVQRCTRPLLGPLNQANRDLLRQHRKGTSTHRCDGNIGFYQCAGHGGVVLDVDAPSGPDVQVLDTINTRQT